MCVALNILARTVAVTVLAKMKRSAIRRIRVWVATRCRRLIIQRLVAYSQRAVQFSTQFAI